MPKPEPPTIHCRWETVWLGFYQAALAGLSVNEQISNAAEWAAKTADLALNQYIQRFHHDD